ncbi:MAG TPA: DNA/RNA nuclease SfsA [Thermoanaerobacterales bacterium]|nr:DNA/RNA nuclease SfsA [Thermoanaerobacterales bacterium]
MKNTCWCKELLIPNATIFMQEYADDSRKTKYSLVIIRNNM